jgi:hypothetical protein
MEVLRNGWTIVQLMILAAVIAIGYWFWSPLLHTARGAPETMATVPTPSPTPAPTLTPTAVPGQPFCQPGQEPEFVLGFAQLKQQLGDTMGQPLECEHPDPTTGDSLQQTTTGLAVYQRATGALRFTDGWHHWSLQDGALRAWEGDGTEPVAAPTEVPAAAPADTLPVLAGTTLRVTGTDGAGVVLRSAPEEASRLPTGFAEGTRVVLLRQSGTYVLVEGDSGQQGWIPVQYVEPAP